MPTDTFWKCFYELYEAIPRQGPGDRQSTERALHLIPHLKPGQRILDIGCGTGAQTIDLARATEHVQIVAIDNHAPFVARTTTRAEAPGLTDRITLLLEELNTAGTASLVVPGEYLEVVITKA